MRTSGVRGLLVYCGDYRCGHSVEISADRWGDDARLSDLEPLFTCQAYGKKAAEVRPGQESNPTRDVLQATRVGPRAGHNDRAKADIVSSPQQLFCSFDGTAVLIRALGSPMQVRQDRGCGGAF